MNRLFITPIIKQIVIGCVIFFIGGFLLENKQIDLKEYFALHYIKTDLFRPWQFISHMFMHGGLTHLLFNMIALITIGGTIENFLGGKKFITLYFVSGIGAVAIHMLSQFIELYHLTGIWIPSPDIFDIELMDEKTIRYNTEFVKDGANINTIAGILFTKVVGASGAIYGVVTAFAYLFPNTQLMIMFIPYPIKAKYLIPGFIALDLFLGISNFGWDPIAHFAHIGGAIFGFALVYYWRKFDKTNFY